MATTNSANQHLIVTAFCEVNSGEEGAVAALLKDFLPQAQREPGVKEFQIHQTVAKPREFFFYEIFADALSFADHQQIDVRNREVGRGRQRGVGGAVGVLGRGRDSGNAPGDAVTSARSGPDTPGY